MLNDVPGLRCAGEVLHNSVPFPYRHILGRAAGCTAEAYGCKVLSYQIKDVQRPPDGVKTFSTPFTTTMASRSCTSVGRT